MRRPLTVLLCSLLLIGGAAHPASGSRSVRHSKPALVELAAINRISAQEPGSLTVRVPKTTSLSYSYRRHNPGVAIEGGGRLAAIFLVEAGAGDPRSLYVGRFRTCPTAGCAEGKGRFFLTTYRMREENPIRIPAGRYKLYVITDGAPVEITLKLDGLTGESRLRPTQPITMSLDAPPVHVSTPGDVAYSAGGTQTLAETGLMMSFDWLESPASIAAISGSCSWKGRPPIPQTVAYLPGCSQLGAMWESRSGPTVATPQAGWSLGLSPILPPGEWSYGHYFIAPGIVEEAGGFVLWMEY